MTGGLTELPPHQGLRAGRGWWRRLRFLPLVLLAVCSLLATGAGIVVSRAEREADVPFQPTYEQPVSEPGAICRPAVAAPAAEPWLDDRAAAEAVWQEHSEELAKPYIIGPNGWVFWSDSISTYASQAVGRANLTRGQVDRWVQHFTEIRDELASRDIDFYVIVTPSTSSVYPEELPTWMQSLRGSTVMDQLMSASGDLPIMDLRADLIAAKGGPYNLFSWSNSHWTDFGAYTAWAQIAACTNALAPDSPPLQVPPITGATVVGDFNEWAPYGVPSLGADWARPDYAEQLPDVTRTDKDGETVTISGDTTTDLSIIPAETSTSAPWTGKSALIFRDSMGGGLSALWQQAYSPTWQLPEPYINGYTGTGAYREAVDKYHPDVVIVQLAERYLLNAPAAGDGY